MEKIPFCKCFSYLLYLRFNFITKLSDVSIKQPCECSIKVCRFICLCRLFNFLRMITLCNYKTLFIFVIL